MALAKNIKLKRGDDESFLIKVLYPDKTPANLTGVAHVDLHANIGGKAVITLSERAGIEFISRKKGELLIEFPHELTQAETWQQAAYDLQLTFDNCRVKTVLMGDIHLIRDITPTTAAKMHDSKSGKLAYSQVIETVIAYNKPETMPDQPEQDDDDNDKEALEIPDFKFIVEMSEI